MRAIVFNQRNNVTLQERPDPKPGAGEVLVETSSKKASISDSMVGE